MFMCMSQTMGVLPLATHWWQLPEKLELWRTQLSRHAWRVHLQRRLYLRYVHWLLRRLKAVSCKRRCSRKRRFQGLQAKGRVPATPPSTLGSRAPWCLYLKSHKRHQKAPPLTLQFLRRQPHHSPRHVFLFRTEHRSALHHQHPPLPWSKHLLPAQSCTAQQQVARLWGVFCHVVGERITHTTFLQTRLVWLQLLRLLCTVRPPPRDKVLPRTVPALLAALGGQHMSFAWLIGVNLQLQTALHLLQLQHPPLSCTSTGHQRLLRRKPMVTSPTAQLPERQLLLIPPALLPLPQGELSGGFQGTTEPLTQAACVWEMGGGRLN